MRRGPEPKHSSPYRPRRVATTSRKKTSQTAMTAAVNGMESRQRQWDNSCPTPGVCTTCTATYLSGSRTVGIPATKVRLSLENHGSRKMEATATHVCFEADPGTTV